MIKEGKFGLHEAVSLMTMVIITKMFYTSIRVLIKTTGTAAWYTVIISSGLSMLAFYLVYLLMKRFQGYDLVEIFQKVTGKVIGKTLALAFSVYFIYYAGSNLREFLEMIKAYNLPYTSPSLILFAFIASVIILAYLGLETIARVSRSVFYVIIIGVILILLLAYPIYNVDRIFPIGGHGIKTSLYTGLFRVSAYDEVIILAFIINSIHGIKNFKKAGYISLIIALFTIGASIFCSIIAFEYPSSAENLSSLFQLSRVIYFNRFFQRIESVFLFIWVMASLITVATSFYMSLSIYCKAFKLDNYKPLLLPCAFLTFMVSILPESLSEITESNIVFIREYSVFFVYGVPILVLLISLILGKKGGKLKNEKG